MWRLEALAMSILLSRRGRGLYKLALPCRITWADLRPLRFVQNSYSDLNHCRPRILVASLSTNFIPVDSLQVVHHLILSRKRAPLAGLASVAALHRAPVPRLPATITLVT